MLFPIVSTATGCRYLKQCCETETSWVCEQVSPKEKGFKNLRVKNYFHSEGTKSRLRTQLHIYNPWPLRDRWDTENLLHPTK